ncbi:putative multiheme cytochrome c [Thermincola ferriacetica]|uniref:Putative multiheme cytochrome c n=1 Tax=Thermincola ferriacetica TaxID=281456 RepID=A0A0L6W2G2_9FIRM|nr:cytochrome c3 family protein [Thermincola ferriacetica]KNZ69269.1 putative multiheme cytochrome c [Thermincola ferriacetica]
MLMRKSLILACFFLFTVISPALAAVTIDGVKITYESPTTSVSTVYFQGTPPFTIYCSLDGQDWSQKATGVTVSSFTYTGCRNYVNYYFKIQDSTGSTAVGVAFPPDNNPHGSYKTDSSYCAACHVTHAASGVYLMKAPNAVALCTTCHDGTQSKYDVMNGRVKLPNGDWAETSGGPFGALRTEENLPVGESVYSAVYAGYTSESNVAINNSPTSIHNLGVSFNVAPGGVSDRLTGLSCESCHDPHGKGGNFRNLRTVIRVTDTLSVNVNFRAFAETDPAKSSGYGENITYDTGSIYFCSACHSDYNQPSGSGSVAATSTQQPGFPLTAASMNKFIHAVNTPLYYKGEYLTTSLPLEVGTGVNTIVCITCHHSHGTARKGISQRTGSTALIRLDRQAVCEECHKK